MGQSPSKRVESSLRRSPEFAAACDAAFEEALSQAQYAFAGVRLYQLYPASVALHASLVDSHPLVSRWVPSPPAREMVDAAARRTGQDELDRAGFEGFAVDVFTRAVMGGAAAAVANRFPVGAAAIAAVGLLARAGVGTVGGAAAVYAAAVAAAVYAGLG